MKIKINNVNNLKIDDSKLFVNGKNDKEWHRISDGTEWTIFPNDDINSVHGSLIITFEENEALSIRQNICDIFAKLSARSTSAF